MTAGLVSALCGAFLIAWGTADARTWQWQIVVHNPDRAPVDARSGVELNGRDLVMNYGARLNGTDVPIASCRGQVPDVANARIVTSAASYYLYVAFKPGHAAQCRSGSEPVALIPVANDSAATDAAAAINRACCGTAGPKPVVAANAAPSPTAASARTPTPSPALTPQPKSTSVSTPKITAAPKPKRSAGPHLLVTDWSETDGLFTFVRVRNRGPEPVMISDGQVADCNAVAVGCGAFARSIVVDPGSTAVVATVMSADPVNDATFSYQYEARAGEIRMTARGTSRTRLSGWRPALPARDMKFAEAAAVATLRSGGSGSPPPAPPVDGPARLMQRGSSRLAIGQTGQARVRVRVNSKGTPINASIISISNPALIAAALETAVSSQYAPAVRNGRSVDEDYVATFQFDGQDPALSQIPVWKRAETPPPSIAPSPGPS